MSKVIIPKHYGDRSNPPSVLIQSGQLPDIQVAGRCCAEVPGRWNGFQCLFKSGSGPAKMLCKRHARQAARDGWEIIE